MLVRSLTQLWCAQAGPDAQRLRTGGLEEPSRITRNCVGVFLGGCARCPSRRHQDDQHSESADQSAEARGMVTHHLPSLTGRACASGRCLWALSFAVATISILSSEGRMRSKDGCDFRDD